MLLYLNVVMMMQAQYAYENAAWFFYLAAPNFGIYELNSHERHFSRNMDEFQSSFAN